MTCESCVESRYPGEICLPVLETERLVLRTPRLEDAAAIAAMADDRTVAENTAVMPHPYRLKDAEDWIATCAEPSEGASFALFLKDGPFIGACGVGLREGALHLGYWLGRPHRGKGYATEAVHAVIDFTFSQLGVDEITSAARVTNDASRGVLEKCGFQWTGAGLVRIRALGASVPIDRFRLARRAWASLRTWGRTPLTGEVRPCIKAA